MNSFRVGERVKNCSNREGTIIKIQNNQRCAVWFDDLNELYWCDAEGFTSIDTLQVENKRLRDALGVISKGYDLSHHAKTIGIEIPDYASESLAMMAIARKALGGE